MKKFRFFIVLGVMLLLFTATAWASNRLDVSKDSPAILASLDQKTVTPLDDAAIAEIRGQALYVMVKIFPLNFLDRFPAGVGTTWNPLLWRYGNFGGAGYGGGVPVDGMDALFAAHDAGGPGADAVLFGGLLALPKEPYPVWGQIYQPNINDLPGVPYAPPDGHSGYIIQVSRLSVMSVGGRFFWGRKPMPLPEYARRQALVGAAALSLF